MPAEFLFVVILQFVLIEFQTDCFQDPDDDEDRSVPRADAAELALLLTALVPTRIGESHLAEPAWCSRSAAASSAARDAASSCGSGTGEEGERMRVRQRG